MADGFVGRLVNYVKGSSASKAKKKPKKKGTLTQAAKNRRMMREMLED